MTLDEAYDTVLKAEKDLVVELATLGSEFQERLNEIKSRQPDKGGHSTARQYLNRIESNINSVFTYDLQSVQNTYGISQPAPVTPAG
jgi:hypothetical protein